MQEINIYDSEGNIIYELAQWDQDIKIYIKEQKIDKAYNVHFFNRNNDEAMVVPSTYENGTLCSPVPNDLLTEDLPINGYVFIDKNGEYKSLYYFRILVRKRTKPADYIYSDKIEYITFQEVLQEAKEYALAAKESEEKASNAARGVEDVNFFLSNEKLCGINFTLLENQDSFYGDSYITVDSIEKKLFFIKDSILNAYFGVCFDIYFENGTSYKDVTECVVPAFTNFRLVIKEDLEHRGTTPNDSNIIRAFVNGLVVRDKILVDSSSEISKLKANMDNINKKIDDSIGFVLGGAS